MANICTTLHAVVITKPASIQRTEKRRSSGVRFIHSAERKKDSPMATVTQARRTLPKYSWPRIGSGSSHAPKLLAVKTNSTNAESGTSTPARGMDDLPRRNWTNSTGRSNAMGYNASGRTNVLSPKNG